MSLSLLRSSSPSSANSGEFMQNCGATRNRLQSIASRITVMLLECGICDISRVLVLARNSVYSARSVEDAIPHVYKMEGHRSFRENPLILSS